ncbi:MAG: TadE/TadG family type IV pilus assembly protein [Faecalibacterium sp.]
MKKWMGELRKKQEGAIALEACISLTLFLIVMITLYSMIRLFTAQSVISHAIQETCQSMALENYGQNSLATGTLQAIPNALITLITGGFNSDYSRPADFSLRSLFWDVTKTAEQLQSATELTARNRFAAYLSGSVEEADRLLKNYGVVGGLNGISFSGTNQSGTDLTVQVSYKIRLVFYLEMFHFGEFESTQTVCSRLWK